MWPPITLKLFYTKKNCTRFLLSDLQFIDFVKNLQFQVVFLKNQRTFDETCKKIKILEPSIPNF